MKKFEMGKDALTLSIMTLITILTWVGFDIYRAYSKSTIPQVTREQMKTLNPEIKRSVVDSLKGNLSFSQEELETIIQTPTPAATEAGQTATEDGILEE
jgi:hypothetical protein